MNIYMRGDPKKMVIPRLDIVHINCYFLKNRSFLDTSLMKYMHFIIYMSMLTLFYKFVIFSINLFFDHDICYFLKHSAGNTAHELRVL